MQKMKISEQINKLRMQQQITENHLNLLISTVEKLTNQQKEIVETVKIVQEENRNEIDKIRAESDKKLEVTINQMRVARNKWGFDSQSDFGMKFKVSIGSKTVGKLFRVVGLAKKSKTGRIEPMRRAIESGKAATEIANGYEVFRWHHEKCLEHVENWLSSHNLLGKFYSFDKEKDLREFIQYLYNVYCDDNYGNYSNYDSENSDDSDDLF